MAFGDSLTLSLQSRLESRVSRLEADDGVETSTGTVEDLKRTADVEAFDETFEVTADDVEFGADQQPAIPRPWQGLPRAAIVYNLGYVYDDSAGEWVRQKKGEVDGTQPFPEGLSVGRLVVDQALQPTVDVPAPTTSQPNAGSQPTVSTDVN